MWEVKNKAILDVKEKDIEARLVRKIRALSGLAWKFTSPQRRSVPDRLCILPRGIIFFVELKAPGKTLTKAQGEIALDIMARGAECWMVSTYEEVDFLIDIYKIRLGT